MIENFDKSVAFVLEMEGGYTLDPNDPGGETNFGISKKAYPSVDIKNLTVDDAKEIYLRDYWRGASCDQLPWPFDASVFDTAVNQGVGKAIRILQVTLGVDVDGVIGDKTIAAAHKALPRSAKLFLANRLAEYSKLMASNPKLLVFAVNWSFRIISLAEFIFHE